MWFKIKVIIGYTAYGLLFGLGLYLGYYHEEARYGLGQLRGQLGVIFGAVPVADKLADPTFSEAKKDQLRLIARIKQFGVDSLGLDPSGSYETYYEHGDTALIWNVSACRPYELKAYQWHFPLAGAFGYKGFFDKAKAEAEAARLEAQGYETRLRPVSAWSTLGWLHDPTLSGMLRRDTASLANLILHELTHGTLFVPGSLAFNENLASFVGDYGAERFLAAEFGADSPELLRYQQRKSDRDAFAAYIVTQSKALDSLYRSFPPSLPEAEKAQRKAAFFTGFVAALQAQEGRFHNPGWAHIFDERPPTNNFFLSYLRYRGQQNQFREAFEQEFGGDFAAYLAALKERYPTWL